MTATLAARYRLERELGRGGMATVYLAHDLKHDRPVALKALREEVAASLGAERFLREILIAAGLQHPNILPLHDSGTAGGTLYYVMPYVEGESLRQRIAREGPLPTADAVSIASEVADALSYAHSRGVVHRDIKPENILLSGGHALVADFGIARALTAATDAAVTAAGVAVGTPAYMSPEQATAAPLVDGRSDLYSLGCVVFEMLAGAPPFDGPSAQAILARHTMDAVPSLRGLRRDLPPGLEAAVVRALAKVPADRYATTAAFRDALQGRATPRPARRARPGRRLLLAGAALVLAVLGYVGGRRFWSSPLPPSVAVLPFRNLNADADDAAFSDGMAEELTTALGRVPGLRVAAPTSAAAFRDKAVTPQEIGRALGVGTLVQGTVRRAEGRWRVVAHLINARTGYDIWSDEYERAAKDVFAVQDQITQAIVGALRIRLAAPMVASLASRRPANPEAHDLYLQGRYFYEKRTGGGLRKAETYFQQAIEKDSTYALAYTGLADTYSFEAAFGFEAPNTIFPRAIAAARRALALNDNLPEAHTSLGFIALFYNWDWPTADREFRRALALDSVYTPAILFHGWYQLAAGDPDAAVRDVRRARALDPLSLIINTRLATMLYLAGRDQDAVDQLHQALELDSSYDLAHAELARVDVEMGRCADAFAQLRDRPAIAAPEYEGALYGYAAARCGRPAEAHQALDSILTRIRRGGAYTSPAIAAYIYSGLGDRDDAIAWLDRAVRDRS